MKNAILISFLIFINVVNTQTIRNYSNEFMNIGVDARALGMGSVMVAHTNDVNSCYWNPTGLLKIDDSEASFMHASYYANLAQYDYLGYAKKIDDRSAWGASVIRFGVDNIMNTTQLIDNNGNIDYNRISLFSAADYGATFSYARHLPIQNFNYGVNAKVIRRVIGDFASSWGFGFDFGMQYAKNNWNFGIMLRDITTTYNVWNINQKAYKKIQEAQTNTPLQNQELPQTTEITLPKAQIGFSKKHEFHNDMSLLGALNLNMSFHQTNDLISSKAVSISPALGFEWGYNNLAFLRTGISNVQNTKNINGDKSIGVQPNLGLGFHYKGIFIDYALTNIGSQSASLYSNVFSIKIDLSIFR